MLFVLLFQMLNAGVQILPPAAPIVVLRTDKGQPYHPIIDNPRYVHLKPYLVTVKTIDKAIRTIAVMFDVVTPEGMKFEIGGGIYSNSRSRTGMAIDRNSSCVFYPGGWMPESAGPSLMVNVHDFNVIQRALSVTVSIDYVEFEDGTIAGTDTHDIHGAIARRAAARLHGGK